MGALTVCRIPGCPTLTPTGLCPHHTREADQKRGSRQARGYDATHTRERSKAARQVATGNVKCWRCGELIRPGEPWDLGHSTDRKHYKGAEHRACNRATMGRERQT